MNNVQTGTTTYFWMLFKIWFDLLLLLLFIFSKKWNLENKKFVINCVLRRKYVLVVNVEGRGGDKSYCKIFTWCYQLNMFYWRWRARWQCWNPIRWSMIWLELRNNILKLFGFKGDVEKTGLDIYFDTFLVF